MGYYNVVTNVAILLQVPKPGPDFPRFPHKNRPFFPVFSIFYRDFAQKWRFQFFDKLADAAYNKAGLNIRLFYLRKDRSMIRNYLDKAKAAGSAIVRSRILPVSLMCIMLGMLTVGLGTLTNVVTIYDEDMTRTLYTMHTEEEDILRETGLDLTGCETEFSGISNGTGTLTIYRPKQVQITDGNGTVTVTTCNDTVEEVLNASGITLGEKDLINVPLKAQAATAGTIVVTRIAEQLVEEVTEIPYGTSYKYTPLLKDGKQLLLSAGTSGKIVNTYRETLVDGEVTARELVSTVRQSEPVNQVMLVGSSSAGPISPMAAPAGVTIGADGVPSSYKRVITNARATAYTSKKGAVTYSGLPAMVGHVGVNKDEIPLGSLLYITSPDNSVVYGFAIAADIGYGTVADIVDLDVYLDSVLECKYFGGRKMNIYIL